jgi:phosphate starvation-inducible protein PhoH and related proteins
MSSLPHTADVYQMKRKPKNPIKFNVQLNEEQKKAKAVLLHNPITVLRGGAGSGKTLLAAQVALDLLLGFLPGDIREKMDPWLAPIYHNLYMLYNKEKIDKEVEKGTIEIVPFAFIRGRTFVDSFVIVDEAQNVTHTQMQAVIGRLGKNSKMVICGDIAQIDLRDKRTSGFSFLNRLEENVEGFRVFTLTENHRHEIVSPILSVYELYRE